MKSCCALLLGLCFLICLHQAVYSQSAQTLIRNGDRAVKTGNYYGAADAYRRALEISKTSDIAFKYAEVCRINHNYPDAIKWYSFVLFKEMDKFTEARFWLADVYKSTGEYQKAQFHYGKYLNKVEDDPYHDVFLYEKAKHEILACEKAFYYKLDPVGVDIQHLDNTVNSEYSEFGITDIADTSFVFGSLRPEGDPDISAYRARIYSSAWSGETYGRSKLIDSLINRNGSHISNPHFSKNNSTMYFCVSSENEGVLLSSVFRSVYRDNCWTEPEKLGEPVNVEGTVSTQPSVAHTKDHDYLMFVSNREGGIGGLDIWYCEMKPDGSFGPARNMGCNLNKYPEEDWHFFKPASVINSIDDEITPFFSTKDSTLYFSSKWHYSMGGFDIFKSQGDFLDWTEPENLGYPINTHDNELYYYINSKGSITYFASNRAGSLTYRNDRCCNDIYSFPVPDYSNEEEMEENKITVLEKEIRLLVPLTLYFHNDEPNPRTRDTVTQYRYDETYNSYVRMQDEYKTEFAKGAKKNMKQQATDEIENFFNDEVIQGFEDLENFTMLMVELLERGEDIEITIKGYASPLHATDYNVNLSKRRINSLINYYYQYNDSMLLPYIDGTAPKGNRLKFIEEAFGEDTASHEISDDLSDIRNSVYSPAAAFERKIKVIAISLTRKTKQE